MIEDWIPDDRLPDPDEIIESRVSRLVEEWIDLQHGVPDGSFRCPDCRQLCVGEPIQVSADPDSPVCCYDCLPPDVRAKYDEFCRRCGDAGEY